MGLPTPVSFRTSQPNAASILPAAPQKADTARDQDQFERHLDDNQTQGSASADRREASRRADRREQDRAEKGRADNARDSQKADSDTVPQSDSDTKIATTTEPDTGLTDAKSTQKDDTKAASDTTKKAADAGTSLTTDTAAQPTAKDAAPKADQPQDATASTDASNVIDATPKPTANTAKKADEPSTDLAGMAAASVAKPVETRKAETKTPSAEPKVAAAPAPKTPSPVAADAANVAPKAEASQPTADNVDPDAKLTISSKEGLGHEAAAKMADKNDAKAATAQVNGPNAPTQAQAAPTASATTQNFAKMVATASGGEVSSVTSVGNGSSGTGALSDLQNVATTTQSQNTNAATVRIGTLPGQTTPTQVPAMTIALQVARNLQKGINRFDIRLDPAEMGRIDVRMEVKKDGSVATHMIVERPETLELLRRDATTLQQALNNAGLQSNPDSLNFSLRDGNAGNQPQNFAGNTQGSSGLSNFESSPDNAVLSPIYNINTSANGGIDIRV